MKKFIIEKPVKPIKPDTKDTVKYPRIVGPNIYGNIIPGGVLPPKFQIDYKKYIKDMEQYELDLERFEQFKLIRLIKNSSDVLCLKKYKIVKR